MILTVDIGNTNITCGLFDGEVLTKKFRLPSDTDLTVQDYNELFTKELGSTSPDGAIIGSVVEDLNDRIQYSILASYGIKAHILSRTSNMPISVSSDNLGADRIANGIRGYNLFKNAVIVVDFGTATTFDIVNSKGEFIGGLIAPGIKTQLKSLKTSTSKLPNITVSDINTAIGTDTKDAILAGVIKGSACMVDGMLSQVLDELKEPAIIIATGGYCELLAKHLKTPIELHPNLTLEGLRDAFILNKPLQPVFSFTQE